LIGNVELVPEPEITEARKLYLDRHANSKDWVDFDDFAFYRMEIVDVYYVGGFGVMDWVSASEYDRAKPDPLVDFAGPIIQHMNSDHEDALLAIALHFAGTQAQQAQMLSIDRLGFGVRLKTPEGMRGIRIAFPREIGSRQEARDILIEMTREAQKNPA